MSKSGDLQTISVSLPRALVQRLRGIKYKRDISLSSIIEASLNGFLEGMTEEGAGDLLKQRGAGLRRHSE